MTMPGRLRRLLGGAGAGSADPLAGRVRLPAHAIYVHWDFGPRPLTSLSFDITMHTDPGSGVGEYFSPYNGTIDGHQIYFGIQTDVFRPEVGGVGKGCIFSTWWTFDAADTRPEADGGFIQLGTHEGRFVGVRRTYDWGIGDYRLTVTRAEPDGDGDWFAMSVQPIAAVRTAAPTDAAGSALRPEATGPAVPLGALRFRRAEPDVPATIKPGGPAFLEIYGGANTYADIADWSLDVMGYGDDVAAVSARSDYPAFPHAEVPNADVHFDAVRGRVALRFGSSAVRTHAPSVLF